MRHGSAYDYTAFVMPSNFVGIEIELAINLETVVDGRQKTKKCNGLV